MDSLTKDNAETLRTLRSKHSSDSDRQSEDGSLFIDQWLSSQNQRASAPTLKEMTSFSVDEAAQSLVLHFNLDALLTTLSNKNKRFENAFVYRSATNLHRNRKSPGGVVNGTRSRMLSTNPIELAAEIRGISPQLDWWVHLLPQFWLIP
ncbi:hypothetical protein ACOME3_000605 [Neoechinorhynchus agilis]